MKNNLLKNGYDSKKEIFYKLIIAERGNELLKLDLTNYKDLTNHF